jgi:hypothetical protein
MTSARLVLVVVLFSLVVLHVSVKHMVLYNKHHVLHWNIEQKSIHVVYYQPS